MKKLLHLWMRGEQGLLPALPLARLSTYSHSIFVSEVRTLQWVD